MFKTYIKISDITVGTVKNQEDLQNEYKEFSIIGKKKELVEDELMIKKLIRGKFPNEINKRIINSVYSYLDKYFVKYFTSLSNLNKNCDNTKSKSNFSRFYIGVNDNPSVVSGIPIYRRDLEKLISGINIRVIGYLKKIRAFHRLKSSNKYIEFQGNKYYNFDKLLSIIFRLFKINIHLLNKKKLDDGVSIKKKINNIYKKKRIYNYKVKEYIKLKDRTKFLNNKFSQSLTILLFNYEVINTIDKFIKITYPNFPFKPIHKLLKKHINDKKTISNYIDDGHYVNYSIISTEFSETELNSLINIFLRKIREYRNIQIQKVNMISRKIVKPYKKRFNPLDSISTTILQINSFNDIIADNNDIVQILIEIEIPVIRDKNAILGYHDGKDWKFPLRKLVNICGRMSPITYIH